jgi:thioredoxin-related protein
MDLIPELIEGQMVLIENSGKETIEDMFDEQNRSIDALLNNGYTFDVLEYWFDILEKRSIYPSVKYLALKVLEEIEILPKTLRYKLENYRSLDKETLVPNFQVSDERMLYDIEGKKLLLFSDSGCTPCTDIMPSVISSVHDKPITLIIVSNEVKDASILHTTDESLFDSYFVFATPTMIVVDEENKLYLKPNNTEHLKAYINTI